MAFIVFIAGAAFLFFSTSIGCFLYGSLEKSILSEDLVFKGRVIKHMCFYWAALDNFDLSEHHVS